MPPPSQNVAVLVETSKSFGRGLVRGISHYATRHTRWSLLMEERGLDDPIPGWALENCHGIVLRTREQAPMAEVLRSGIPTVCMGEDNPPGAHRVEIDQHRVAVLAADHLLNRGFERFGYVGVRGYSWSDRRRDAFVSHI